MKAIILYGLQFVLCVLFFLSFQNSQVIKPEILATKKTTAGYDVAVRLEDFNPELVLLNLTDKQYSTLSTTGTLRVNLTKNLLGSRIYNTCYVVWILLIGIAGLFLICGILSYRKEKANCL